MAAFLFCPARALPEGVGVERWEIEAAGRVMLFVEPVRWGNGARAVCGFTVTTEGPVVPGAGVTVEGVPFGVTVPFVSAGGWEGTKGTI